MAKYMFHIVTNNLSDKGSSVGEILRYQDGDTFTLADLKEFYEQYAKDNPNVSTIITGVFPLGLVSDEDITRSHPNCTSYNSSYKVPETKSHIRMLRELMGYVEDDTDETIKLFQDDATGTFWVKCENGGKEVWAEWGFSLEESIEKAHNMHIPPEGE